MKTSTSILVQNTLESGMMKVLVLLISTLLIFGCNSYQVELDPAWENESSDSTDLSDALDPTTEDPTDDEPPWIELSDDNTDPTESDTCALVDCFEFGPFCDNDLAVECCGACSAGTQACHPVSPMISYTTLFICAGGCWETSLECDNMSYCQNSPDGEPYCNPLPTEYDGFCEPGLEWIDPDCQTCTPCDTLGESYCDHSGFSDTLIECRDITGYGHYCWDFEICTTTVFESVCVADLATNFAACSDQNLIEDFCSQLTCTGTTTCDGDSGSAGNPIDECGYCGVCCDATLGPLCGYDGPYQGGAAAILYPTDDLICYDVMSCSDMSTTEQYYCKMSYEDGPICELAVF